MSKDNETLDWGSYHDNCWTKTLLGFIDDPIELARQNIYRNPEITQKELNKCLIMAIIHRLDSHPDYNKL